MFILRIEAQYDIQDTKEYYIPGPINVEKLWFIESTVLRIWRSERLMKVTDHRRVCMHIVVIKDTGNRNILLFGPYMTFFIE